MRSKFASVLMAFLLVTSGMAASTGAASAQTLTDSECTGIISFVKNAVSLGLTGTGTAECAPTNTAIKDMKDSDANQTKTDIYNAAAAEKGNNEVFNAVYGNYLNDSQSVAWMKMQVAVAEAYQNGSSESVAIAEAKQAISDYYSVKEKNIVEKWRTQRTNMKYLYDTAASEDGINKEFAGYADHITSKAGGAFDAEDDEHHVESYNLSTRTYTLRNGSQVEYQSIQIEAVNAGDGTSNTFELLITTGEDQMTSGHSIDSATETAVRAIGVQEPTSDYDKLYVIHTKKFASSLDRIQTKNSELQTEAENFVNATYADFSSGEANASDVISANTAMFEYATQADGNSSLYDSTAALSMMGFDTPNMSSSGTMDVTYQGNTYTGIVLARNAPGGAWETGTTYNTSNITGPVFLATTDGQKVDFAEGETFTIDQMRAKDGSNTTQVNTTNYVYKTANTSELNEMQSQLIDLREEIEAREPDGGGAGGSGLNDQMMIAIVALAGAALLFGGRQN
ncbi:hypothetical protein [Halobellus inordinatus]|uniref:hypothetical protein n=1 Tax=Halobellus inordinatus TaxID=1126236 RepID=UPI0021143512|nr:hypothetical protein [Halobellus ramosii]